MRYSGPVAEPHDETTFQNRAGLCADCVHARRVESSRGSAFLLCQLSLTDPNFAKYPRLPVLSCLGYVKSEGLAPPKVGDPA